jgi:pimeloyl-ACP methyl ester carboxylesterase
MKTIFFRIFLVLIAVYIGACLFIYFFQEKVLFPDTKLSADHAYEFPQKFEERIIPVRDGKKIDGLLFKSDSSKGLIFYVHGIGHNLDWWGQYAKYYTSLHYDIFFFDYRGYGKSEGKISSENQIYDDVQDVYSNLKTKYNEDSIVVLGYSFGTAPAAMLASKNKPRLLVLQAPYYSMLEIGRGRFPIFPTCILRYPLKTYEFVEKTKVPIVIFHGDNDSTINISAAYKLKKLCKPGDELIIINKQGHSQYTANQDYINKLQKVFSHL